MKQILKNLSVEETTLQQICDLTDYDYVIDQEFSEMKFGLPCEVSINWEEVIELRAFREKETLHIYRDGDELKAVYAIETGVDQECIIKSYEMRNGKKLLVKEYLKSDDDGQAVTEYIRPFAVQ